MQAFVERENVLLTGSKDGHVRAWDLATQHCFQMLAGAYGEVRRALPCIQDHTACTVMKQEVNP